jgi:methionyl-tRNA formyltransferase
MPQTLAPLCADALPHAAGRTRVAVFGSFYRGLHVLQALLEGELASRVQVVGVATDDPAQSFVSPRKRVWQYPHERHEELMVRCCAEQAGIEVWDGRVKTPEFYRLYETCWRPELCVMATFGQRIDARLHQFPRLGFYNLHPCIEDGWPSRYVGGNPFEALQRDGHRHAVLALHHVDDGFDTGALVAYSERIPLPEGAGVVELHRLTAPVAARLVNRELGLLLERAQEEMDHGIA